MFSRSAAAGRTTLENTVLTKRSTTVSLAASGKYIRGRSGAERCAKGGNQLEKLKAEGCSIVRSEKVSGASRNGRKELAVILDFLRDGDELVVTRLDRLGRDTRDVLNLIHEYEQRGAFITVLDPHISTRGEIGHVVMTVLGMVAQMERRFIKERQREGIQKAKANCVYRGGKVRIDREKIVRLSAAGIGAAKIANEVGCSRMQVYRLLKLQALVNFS